MHVHRLDDDLLSPLAGAEGPDVDRRVRPAIDGGSVGFVHVAGLQLAQRRGGPPSSAT